jgi:hypothetical protein
VENPSALLGILAEYLSGSRDARLVLTTPHPSCRRFYDAGAGLGMFSRKAREDHVRWLGRVEVRDAGTRAGLILVSYVRFLLGANQLFVFRKVQ